MLKELIGKKSELFFLFISIAASFFIYRQSFGGYFFQDDWFSLRISSASDFSQFMNFFLPRSDVIYYRPLGMQLPFFLLKSIFGINPLPFKIVTFITHSVNIILVLILANLILKKKNRSLLVAFLYATSSVFFIPFYWFATFAFMLGPTFFFLTLILFLQYLRNNNSLYIYLSTVSFIAGLSTCELVIAAPAVMIIYMFIMGKAAKLKSVMPFLFLTVMLLFLRLVILRPPVVGVYQLGLGGHIISNLKTYLLWSFNWSEIVTEQMIRPFVFNSLITEMNSSVANVSVSSLIIFTIVIIFGLIKLSVSRRNIVPIKLAILGVFWFIAGLVPVLLFPFHKYPYYLPIALSGFLIAATLIIEKAIDWMKAKSAIAANLALGGMLYLWVLTSMVTVNFNNQEHWAPRRSNLARMFVDKPVNKSGIMVIPFSSENRLALNDQDAFKLLYGSETVTLYVK